MEGNIGELGQYIGVGLTAIGMGGAAIGVGNVAGNFLSGALRNPSAAASQTAAVNSSHVVVTVRTEAHVGVSHTVDGHVRLSEGRGRNEASNSQRDQFLLHMFLLKFEVETLAPALALLTSLARSWSDSANLPPALQASKR